MKVENKGLQFSHESLEKLGSSLHGVLAFTFVYLKWLINSLYMVWLIGFERHHTLI